MKILNLEPQDYSAEAHALVEKAGTVENGPLSRTALKKNIKNYDALIVRLGHNF